jgi:predicted Zn-dependent protease
MRNLRLALSFLVGVGIVVALVLGLTGWTIRFLVAFVPVAWEADLSRSAWEQMRTNITVIEPAEWPGSFHLSTNRLMASLPRSPYHFEFVLVSNREPNAIALPAGRILVHSGLFEFADQPEQIAGVLAHEMAHVTQRHGLQQLISSAGPYYVLRLFISDRRGFGALVRNGSLLLVRQNYSREHEREADALAWHHLVNARIDPQSLISFFEKLASNPLERLMDIKGLRLLRSHPPTTERIEDLRRLGRSQRRGIEFIPLTNAVPL